MSTPARQSLLVGLMLGSEVLYVAMLRLNAINGVRPVLTFLAIMAALFALCGTAFVLVRDWRDPGQRPWWTIAVGAVLFRLTLLPAGLPHDASPPELLDGLRADLRGERVAYERFLLYDTDVWRYLWDGHVWAHGVNPFAHPPNADAMDELVDLDDSKLSDGRSVWPDVRDNINHPHVPTIYPPLAQIIFRASHALAPGSVFVMKGLLVGFDLLAGLFIVLAARALGRSPAWTLLYLWNPLVVKVFAGSGHVDSLTAAALAGTAYLVVRRRNSWAAVAFGLAILSKLAPLILVPFVGRRLGRRNLLLAGLVVAVGYVPFLSAGRGLFAGLWRFAGEWQFNAGAFALARGIAASLVPGAPWVARIVCGAALLAFLLWLAQNDDGRAESFPAYGAGALGALLVLSPAVMPWYVAWLLPLAVIAQQRVWFFFSGLVCLAFLVMVDGIEHDGALIIEYGALALLLLRENPLAFRSGQKLALETPAAGSS